MANVLHPHIDFHPRPVAHAPSPFGFGFGLGPSSSSSMMPTTGWGTTTPGHTNPSAFHQLASSVTHSASMRPQKRRMSPEDDSEHGRYSAASTSRDESMDRSPSPPDRPKHAAPKRARIVNSSTPNIKNDARTRGTKGYDSPKENDVDIGVLLASLPPQSLLPLLLSLLKEQPSLKDTILPLIPRPTLETAVHALAQSAKRLTDAQPFATKHTANTRGYILGRLQTHIGDYESIWTSYLPYFSCMPPSVQHSSSASSAGQTHGTPHQQLNSRDKFHPAETFSFLQAVTSHILSQFPEAQDELVKRLLPALAVEWKMWVTRLDEQVNGQSRIVGSDVVRTWRRGLKDLVEGSARNQDATKTMKEVRNKWESSVGWLQPPSPSYYAHAMDEH